MFWGRIRCAIQTCGIDPVSPRHLVPEDPFQGFAGLWTGRIGEQKAQMVSSEAGKSVEFRYVDAAC